MIWHNTEIEKVMEITGSSVNGLPAGLVGRRLAEVGPNELQAKKKRPPWVLFVSQFRDFMILVLVAAAIISGIAGDLTDSIIILVIVLLNAIVGFLQEYRAEKAMEALKKIAALHAQVVRDGHPATVAAASLVPGDLVLLEAGNIVPADIRLTETHGLRIDESALTGESLPAEKDSKIIGDQDIPPGDRNNIAFKSTLVTNGRGKGIVVETGMKTEIGRIAQMLDQEEVMTPLQRRMADFGKKLSYIILGICVLLFLVGLLRGERPLNMLLVSISLAVAAIPEALPALITISLARGAKRLVKRNALVRKLPAVETLGSVTFICSDKTGTLTQNKMKVVQSEIATEEMIFESIHPLHLVMALNHDVKKTADNKWLGDPTEIALVEYFISQYPGDSLIRVRKKLERVAELPFDSGLKYMLTVHRFGDRFLVTSKGAMEAILKKIGGSLRREEWNSRAEEWARDGNRVMGFAYKIVDSIPDSLTDGKAGEGFNFAGLAAMIDPPRDEVKAAIGECRAAGITPVMITGDHPATASAIAGQLGILGDGDMIMTGKELKALDEASFVEKVEKIRVYARVSPEQKLDIVKALQKKGHFVSMTGDGVNDAPSLKSANIGVAMGISGTDVSKEAAHMILLDDNFATIVKAVKEGRRIYDNIRKFVKYIMTCNGAEIWTLFLAPVIGLPIPLQPIHILWINLVTDGLPGLALAGEKAERDIMKRPPRRPGESLFADGIGVHIIWVGLLMAGITLGVQALSIYEGFSHWQTMVFTVLSLSQLAHVMAIRSETEIFYRHGPFRNLPLLGAVIFTFLLQLAVIYWPLANDLLKTQPLTLFELFICVGAAALVFHAVELEKWIKWRRKRLPK